MSSRQRSFGEAFLWRMAGALIFIAMVSKPDAAECASAPVALRAWLIRLFCAAGWTWLSLSIASTNVVADSLRVTPAPAAPAEVPQPLNDDVEEKPRISLRSMASFALLVFIGKLLYNRTSLTTPLASPQSITAWLDVAISTAFWGMFGGAITAKPRKTNASSATDQAEDQAMASPEPPPKQKGFDRVRWLMFALFFGVCFAVALWANGGDLRLGRSWVGALGYWAKLLVVSASLAFFWLPIPAMLSSTGPEVVRITPTRQKPGDMT